MKNLIPAFTFMVLLLSSCGKAPTTPNVLIICIDDLNDWTGFMGGHPQALTPHMDQLASGGMVFRNAFCATAECNPSRAAMLTGYHSKTTGFTNNFLPMDAREWIGRDETGDPISGYNRQNIPDMRNLVTLPQWFREHGYHTMGCGKVFHHHAGDVHVDAALSWSEWGVPQGDELTGNENRNGIYDGKIVWVDWGPDSVETSQTADHRRASWMAERIREYDRDQPFFAAVGFKKPHDPFYAPRQFFDLVPPADKILLPAIHDNGPGDNDHSNLPYRGRIMADKKDGDLSEYEKISGENDLGKDLRYDAVRAYLATTAFTDSCVGVVMEALEGSPHKENTIVVLWSDHGWHLGEKLHYHKFTHWDQALRTLLVINAPGKKPGYTTRVVNAIDIFPTLVELAGLPEGYLQEGYDQQGHSLVPILTDPEISWNTPSVTVNLKRYHPMTSKRRGGTYSDEFMSSSLRTERWKLIEYAAEGNEKEYQYELYDLFEDPEEWDNLAGDPRYHEIRSSLVTLLNQVPGGKSGPAGKNHAPVVVLNTPLTGSVILPGESFRVEAGVFDSDGPFEISSVRFTLNGKGVGEDLEYPFEHQFTRPEGRCEVGIEAVDIHRERTMVVQQF